jgi:hypothetical protein
MNKSVFELCTLRCGLLSSIFAVAGEPEFKVQKHEQQLSVFKSSVAIKSRI